MIKNKNIGLLFSTVILIAIFYLGWKKIKNINNKLQEVNLEIDKLKQNNKILAIQSKKIKKQQEINKKQNIDFDDLNINQISDLIKNYESRLDELSDEDNDKNIDESNIDDNNKNEKLNIEEWNEDEKYEYNEDNIQKQVEKLQEYNLESIENLNDEQLINEEINEGDLNSNLFLNEHNNSILNSDVDDNEDDEDNNEEEDEDNEDNEDNEEQDEDNEEQDEDNEEQDEDNEEQDEDNEYEYEEENGENSNLEDSDENEESEDSNSIELNNNKEEIEQIIKNFYYKKTNNELKDLLKIYNKSTKGNKINLVNRVLEIEEYNNINLVK